MKNIGPTEKLPVVADESEDSEEDPEEDPEEEYEEYIEEVSEERLDSDPEEDLEEEESNAKPKETGFADQILEDRKMTFSKTTDEAAVTKALDVETAHKERRRTTRWDSQPEKDREMGENGYGIKIRKTRWGSDVSQLKTVAPIQLHECMNDFVDSESDAELKELKQRLFVINRAILSLEVYNGKLAREESMLNQKKNLEEKRQELKQELIIRNSKLRPPQVSRKVYVPVKEYPSYKFIGLILGPRGNTLRKMEAETGATIRLRGKGSRCSDRRLLSNNEDLHVHIEARTQNSLEAAVAMVEKLLIPRDDKDNEVKQAQLAELANLKGTSSNTCNVCNESGHMSYACPNRKSTFEKVSACTNCGDVSHHISHCPLPPKANPNREINEANLYVGCLPQTVDENWLKELFCPFGKIISVRVMIDLATGLRKGYGFVNFESPIDAAMAVKHMNGYQVDGKTLAVRVAGFASQPTLPVLSPFPPYPRPAAISAYIPGHTVPWAGPPAAVLSPQLPPRPGLPVLNHIPPYPGPAAISPNISSQTGLWLGLPDFSQNTKDPSGQCYNPSSSKTVNMPSHFDTSHVYVKHAIYSSSGSSQFHGDPDYHGSSLMFPGDPDYRGSSLLFPGDPDYRGSSLLFPGDPDYRGSSSTFY